MGAPQLGYHHPGLGQYIHHEKNFGAPMGDILSDIGNALSTAATKVEGQVTTDISTLTTGAQTAVASSLLATPTGQAVQQQGITAALNAYIAQAQAAIANNPMTVVAVVAGGALLLYAIFSPSKKSRPAPAPQVEYIQMPASPMVAPAKTNPRRHRRRRKQS